MRILFDANDLLILDDIAMIRVKHRIEEMDVRPSSEEIDSMIERELDEFNFRERRLLIRMYQGNNVPELLTFNGLSGNALDRADESAWSDDMTDTMLVDDYASDEEIISDTNDNPSEVFVDEDPSMGKLFR